VGCCLALSGSLADPPYLSFAFRNALVSLLRMLLQSQGIALVWKVGFLCHWVFVFVYTFAIYIRTHSVVLLPRVKDSAFSILGSGWMKACAKLFIQIYWNFRVDKAKLQVNNKPKVTNCSTTTRHFLVFCDITGQTYWHHFSKLVANDSYVHTEWSCLFLPQAQNLSAMFVFLERILENTDFYMRWQVLNCVWFTDSCQ